MKTLKVFLKKHNACEEIFSFAKNLTLKQFLSSCERGDWILWLFKKMNPDDLKAISLAKGHCAKTVIRLMKDKRSQKAVQAYADADDADAAYTAYYAAAYTAAVEATAAKKKNQKETADICIKYLPLEIWNSNLI